MTTTTTKKIISEKKKRLKEVEKLLIKNEIETDKLQREETELDDAIGEYETHKDHIDFNESTKSFIAYKKVYLFERSVPLGLITETAAAIACLKVPKGAERVSSYLDSDYYNYLGENEPLNEKKLRVSEAKVVWIKKLNLNKSYSKKKITEANSSYDNHFKYEVGKTVKPDFEFDSDIYNTCSSGIHCFLTEKAAKNY